LGRRLFGWLNEHNTNLACIGGFASRPSEIQQQQLELKATLDAHLQQVQRQHDASLKRRCAMNAKDAAEEVLRGLDDMEMKDQ
jgi:hypothetical protein